MLVYKLIYCIWTPNHVILPLVLFLFSIVCVFSKHLCHSPTSQCHSEKGTKNTQLIGLSDLTHIESSRKLCCEHTFLILITDTTATWISACWKSSPGARKLSLCPWESLSKGGCWIPPTYNAGCCLLRREYWRSHWS